MWGSYPQPRPAGNDQVRIETIDHDQLLAAPRPGDDPDIADGQAELVGQEPDECRVGGALDGRSRDADLQNAVGDTLHARGRGTR